MHFHSKFLNYQKDKTEVTEFFIQNKSYLIYQDHKKIDEATTRDFFYGQLPAGKTYADKLLLGYYQNDELVCVVDLLKNYPTDGTWVIGLMLLAENKRDKGLGKILLLDLEKYLATEKVKVIRLGVLEDNHVGKAFWQRNGFVKNGEIVFHEDGRRIVVCEKGLNHKNTDRPTDRLSNML